MLFIESTLFTKLIANYLNDDEFMDLQKHLAATPEAGDTVSGTGGLRKVRWKGSGHGKRSGTRIIYFWRKAEKHILLMTIYAKNEVSNLTTGEKKLLREMARRWDDA